MFAWEQDFISDEWAYTENCKPLIWVKPCGSSGRDAWMIVDLEGNQRGGAEATLNGAMSRAVRIIEAAKLIGKEASDAE